MNDTQTTTKYTCRGFRPVSAESLREAAEIFAAREARRQFGRSGYARTCTMGSYTQDGATAEFTAFIGVRTGRHETTGHNYSFTVHRIG
jgi:hypothetical protein